MLRDLLHRVRDRRDLGPLFAALGYAPDATPDGDGWLVVARWRGFRVLAGNAGDARRVASQKARQLAATARPSLVAAVAAVDGVQLALAAPQLGAPGAGPVLVLDPCTPDPVALQILADLGPRADATALAHALRVGDLLAGEGVGARFFTAFRSVLERMTAAVPAGSSADRRLVALLTLTRVLFLYFVQAKGWLDGRTDFLPALLDDALARRKPFHRGVLHPLFFGTLNRPVAARTHGARFGGVPYLNGGLFEPHPVERRIRVVGFSNELWRDTFDDVFERFRFCVREGSAVGTIAPDMLGRTFEGVMATDERQQTGTFYTPEQLVRDLVAATVTAALTDGRAFSADAAARVLAGAPAGARERLIARRRLGAVRLLDPAVGSGAFLLGALELLTRAWAGLTARATSLCELRRRILRDHLFGVDLNPVAVRLAELRLWLAVIADDPETDLARVAPLPNLNGIVRQGDTLFDPLGAARALGIPLAVARSSGTVGRARAAVYDAAGADRDAPLPTLRVAELATARTLVHEAADRMREALKDLVAAARGRDLFGGRSGLTRTQRRHYQVLRRQRRALRVAARRLADGTVPFFAFEVHYPEIMAGGGFTAVVGNPPWVRAERLPAEQRAALKERFTWWQTAPGTGFRHLPDLAVAFLERAFELTAPGGAVGFLLPSKVASAAYGQRARAALACETTLACVHRVREGTGQRFDATVYPLAVVAKRVPAAPSHQVALDFAGTHSLPQTCLTAPGPWVLVPASGRAALDRLRAVARPLTDVARPSLGLKTGADRALVGRVVERDRRTVVVRFGDDLVELEQDLLRPVLRGRDVAAFAATPTRVVLWPYDRSGRCRHRLPTHTAAYAHRITAQLHGRADYQRGPPWCLFRVRGAVRPHRVVWADIARHLQAVALDAVHPDAVPLNSCYVAAPADARSALVLAATLNSTWARVLLHATSDEARGGYRRHNARATGAVPVPTPGATSDAVADLSARAHRDRDVDQDDLDRAVAEALALPTAVRRDLRALADDLG